MENKRFEKLEEIVKGKRVLILVHNNPDPDAIAAGWALSYFLKKKFAVSSRIVYGGRITRPENRTMIRRLGIGIRPLEKVKVRNFNVLAMVDTQPWGGNSSLPKFLEPSIVIDHHSLKKPTQKVDFVDVRPHYGSSATMLTEYLIEAGLTIHKKMATALYFAIKADTQNLGRDATEADYRAAITLYPNVQLRKLSQIEHPELSRDYFEDLDKAIHCAKIHGDVILCDLGLLTNTDMIGFISDLLVRISGVRWSFVRGRDDSQVIFSIRTKRMKQNAGRVAQQLVNGLGSAGGHGMVAGGQILMKGHTPKKEEKLGQTLEKRFLKIVGQEKAGNKLILRQKWEPSIHPQKTTVASVTDQTTVPTGAA
jgi:nanoRNase/pAp phosphatase (c-di-AMP/oligoRNAs hydrolase)